MSSLPLLQNEGTSIALAVAASAGAAYLIPKVLSGLSRPVSKLRGPKTTSYIKGHLEDVVDYDIDTLESWIAEFGTVFEVDGLFLGRQTVIADPKAAAAILSRSMEFKKHPASERTILSWTGPGLFWAEGGQHKKQRRVVSPAFSVPQIKSLEGITVAKAHDLKEIWLSKLQDPSNQGQSLTLDVLDWVGRTALDIIGEAGFGYQLQSLEQGQNELSEALHGLFLNSEAFGAMEFLTHLYPSLHLDLLPTSTNRATRHNRAVMERVGSQLVHDKQVEVARLAALGDDPSSLLGRDLLSVLVKHNMKEADDAKLSDAEILAQISTFIIAGHETSASAIAWTLYALCKNPGIQAKLREELLAYPNDNPTSDALASLPYLDAVVKEGLRRHSPATIIDRTPVNDVVVPLEYPIVDKEGKTQSEVLLKAGEELLIWSAAFNVSTKFWGPDAHEFKPERFLGPLPPAISSIPSIFSSLATFGSGMRGCIGWRFALMEIKAILFVLIRNFEFGIDEKLVVKSHSILVSRPRVEGEEGTKLPLKVSLVNKA